MKTLLAILCIAAVIAAADTASAAAEPAAPSTGVAGGKGPVLTRQQLEAIKQALKAKEPNPLDKVADEMVGAQVKLKQGETGEETQGRQEAAIALLDKLIEQAKQQQCQNCENKQEQQQQQECEKQQNESQPQNSKAQQQNTARGQSPAQRSVPLTGKPGEAATGSEDGGQKGIEWGNLPPRAREEFNQIMKEDFPETYKNLLELYYKNLSEHQ